MSSKKMYITAECRMLARSGDEEAMRVIIHHYMPTIKQKVKRAIKTHLRNESAEIEADLIQDAILCGINAVRSFDENYMDREG